MNLLEIAKKIKDFGENKSIVLIYAFNSTGKTRLSVAYKELTKNENNGKHAGVYYNAFSEDLFVWDNDEPHDNAHVQLKILPSSLNQFHSYIMDDTDKLKEKLKLYYPQYQFELNPYINDKGDKDFEKGIFSITFYHKTDTEKQTPIKISRGEERIFVWCFFLALFEIDGWVGEQNEHIFIDDPVSSLDEQNIYTTADSIFKIIEDHYMEKRIIITTHHIGLFSILYDKLKKGSKSGKYKNITKVFTLNKNGDEIALNTQNQDVFLFHLYLIKMLHSLRKEDIAQYHFVLLRQLLENISSFLGSGQVSYVLEQIGIENIQKTMDRINSLSHKDTYRYQYYMSNPEDVDIFTQIIDKIQEKYKFKI